MTFKHLTPVVAIFIVTSALLAAFSNQLKSLHVNTFLLNGINILLFVVSLLVFFIQKKGIANKNPHAFVRAVMGGMIIKMFTCLGALIVYLFINGGTVNKRAIVGGLILYLCYLTGEVIMFMKMNRKQNA